MLKIVRVGAKLNLKKNKMKVEIWSDVLCPFCYIGKRNFETALEQFDQKEQIEVQWKSFQLDPELPQVAQDSYLEYLIKRKGMSADQVNGMLANVTQTASQAGLEYHLDQSIIVNSLKAHRLLQFASTKNLATELEEKLFHAFFTEGKNIADSETLTELGAAIGLDETEMQTAFTDDNYAYMVKQDIAEGQQIGVQGVPFFVFDRKYGVSGAQPSQVFLENLKVSFSEWRRDNAPTELKMTDGQSCTTDGECK